jgi:hypothetical protein
MLYSKTTGGFYDRAVHRASIPADAIEITVAEHADLLASQSLGMRIAAQSDGRPAIIDPPAPTAEQLATQARKKRDALIAEADYLVMPDYPITSAKLTAIKAYRQALRDVPAQLSFPQSISWPAKP